MKILILTSATTANVYLVNAILERHEVVGMVIESPPPALTAAEKQSRRRRMIERYGRLRTLNKLALNWFRSRFRSVSEARIVREQLFPSGAAVAYRRAVPSITVPNINAPECIGFIDDLRPDLIAVCGTGVIKPEVFTRAPRGAINIHTGITPEYRSADPIFWAIHSHEPDKVGITIHFVDQGIDTGAIIHQRRIALYREDSFASVYARCIATGAQLYLRALEEIAAGTVRTLDRSHVTGKAFYSINLGIIQYLVGCLRFWTLKRRLPDGRPGTAAAVEQDR